MPYSDALAQRVRNVFSSVRGTVEKKMFGGIGFLSRGNMCVGVWQDSLVVRVGPDAYQEALDAPLVREFDITGRPMTGWVIVAADGLDTEKDLREWIDRGLRFVGSLPTKQKA